MWTCVEAGCMLGGACEVRGMDVDDCRGGCFYIGCGL